MKQCLASLAKAPKAAMATLCVHNHAEQAYFALLHVAASYAIGFHDAADAVKFCLQVGFASRLGKLVSLLANSFFLGGDLLAPDSVPMTAYPQVQQLLPRLSWPEGTFSDLSWKLSDQPAPASSIRGESSGTLFG